MSRNSSRSTLRLLLCLAAASLVTAALVACGDEEEQALTFTLTSQGKGTKIAGPQDAETGLAEITLKNDGKADGELQLIRVEGDHSAAEVLQGLEKARQGKPFPDWFFAGGGIGSTGPGKSQTVTQVLEPGTYFAANLEDGELKPSSLASFAVSGDESDAEIPDADATVTAVEYGFMAETLPSGKVEIDFDNSGAQPHHLIASRITGDGTIAEVRKAFKSGTGKPPLQEKGTQNTAVIEGGESQKVTLDLEPGRYALYCFITDRQGGPPHAVKGMVDEVEVE